ncbi:MAG: PorP/SprF family type IX secretion system membrane protein, partial [Bacteroidota bacterium]|nr:PorP/SprF family type IX secretion system membrane protein [Bacteroidota bacterium]
MMKYTLCFFLLSWHFLSAFSQDAHFSQHHHSRLTTNPAFTGSDSTLVLAFNYRNQWPKISPYHTFNFFADKYIRILRSGIGLNYVNDNMMDGAYKKTRLEINFAPHFEVFKHKLVIQPGFQFAYQRNRLDWSKLTFGDMIDERRGFVYSTNDVPGQSTRSLIDFSAGILLYTDHYFGGIAAHHLTQPDEGLIGPSKLPLKLTIHGGANLWMKTDSTKKFILSPTILYMQQQDFSMLLPGITAKYKKVSLGISYRSEDAFIATLAFQSRFF